MIFSDILKKSLKRTIDLIEKDKSMTILSLILLRKHMKRTEILTHCINIVEEIDTCEELLEYIDNNKKYFKIVDDVVVLRKGLLLYSDILYDILRGFDNFAISVSEQQFTINDIISMSMTPSALVLVISGEAENIGYIDLLIYYFITVLLAELFILLSRTYPRFRELVSTIEASFSS